MKVLFSLIKKYKMNVKLFILFSVTVVLFGCFIFFYGFRMIFSKNHHANIDNNVTEVLPPIHQPNIQPVFGGEHRTNQSSPYYTAAVVEISTYGFDETRKYINQMVDVINSPKVKEADIVVLPEAVLNRNFDYIFVPKTTVFCDDPYAHFTFRNISCAAREAKKYVVMNIYARIRCVDDDQAFCGRENYNTNLYNMMFVFDRDGTTIAKYRKYNPYNEEVAITAEPEVVSFHTDFNVTFGVIVCFDLVLDKPANVLLKRGIRNFVFSTMWHNQLPYGTAVQYQQMWSYGHNVNLLAANANWQMVNTTGFGIYAGRAGALKTYVSYIPTSKVLVARVPINLPSENEIPEIRSDEDIKEYPNKLDSAPQDINDMINDLFDIQPLYDEKQIQMDLDKLQVQFLNFSKSSNFNGSVCKGDFCCKYDIEISKNIDSEIDSGSLYFYAIAIFNDYHRFDRPKYVLAKQSYCSLIACTEMDEKYSCGKRFAGDVEHRYRFDKLKLSAVFQMSRESNVFPNTLTNDLYPLNVGAFEFKKSKLQFEEKYSASINLKVPKSNLLTFALFSRDYKKDICLLDLKRANTV